MFLLKNVSFSVWSRRKTSDVLMKIDQSDDGDSIHFLNLQMYRIFWDISTPEF